MGGRLPWRGSRKHCVSESDPPRPGPPLRALLRCGTQVRATKGWLPLRDVADRRFRGAFRQSGTPRSSGAAYSDGQEHLDLVTERKGVRKQCRRRTGLQGPMDGAGEEPPPPRT